MPNLRLESYLTDEKKSGDQMRCDRHGDIEPLGEHKDNHLESGFLRRIFPSGRVCPRGLLFSPPKTGLTHPRSERLHPGRGSE